LKVFGGVLNKLTTLSLSLLLAGVLLMMFACAKQDDASTETKNSADVEAPVLAEDLDHQLSRVPQRCMNSDRCSLRHQHGLSERDALKQEWWLNKPELFSALVQGAKRFEEGMGRGGSFRNI